MPAVYTYEVTRTITTKVSAASVEEAAEKSKPTIVSPERGHTAPEITVSELSIKRMS